MAWQFNPYAVALAASAALSMAVSIGSWRRRSAPGAVPLALLMLAAAEWSLGYSIATGFSDLGARLFWAKIQYVGIVVVPPAMLVFILQYTGRYRWLTKRNLALLAVVPMVTLLLAWTNEFHGLIWAEFDVVAQEQIHSLDLRYGVMFWVHTVYSYLVLLLGVILLLRTVLFSVHLQRRQGSVILIGTLLPWIGNFLYLSGLNPFPYLDLTPFGYSLSGLVMAWGLFRFRLFEIIPVAREVVIESMSEGVLVLDAESRIVDLNPAARRLIGRSASDAVGRPADHVLPPALTLAVSEFAPAETWREVACGERWLDLGLSPLYDQRGRYSGQLVVFRDVTERKRAERALREAKEAAEAASRAKSVFLTNMSHEFRTPLNAILGFSELMASDAGIAPEQRDNLEMIRQSGEQLLALINDLLELSKIEAGRAEVHIKEFDLPHMLSGLVEMFRLVAKDKGLAFSFEQASDVPQYVRTDQHKLRQVLHNLLNNAVKFTAQGRISLRVHANKSSSPSECRVNFEILDTGVGIGQAELEHIFDAFASADRTRPSEQGIGLGLTLSHEFVHLLGGDLIVTSEPGVGTTVRFDVPVELVSGATSGSKSPSTTAGETDQEGEPYSAHLADLSPEWLERLRQATLEGDLERILDLVARIRDVDAVLFDLLTEWAYNFDHDKILGLVRRAKAER